MEVLAKIVGSILMYLLIALSASLLLGRFFATCDTEEES